MIADGLIIAIVAIFVAMGYKAGLMKSLIKVISYLLSIIAAFIAFPHVSDFLMKTKVYEFILSKVNENYPAKNDAGNETLGIFSKYIESGMEKVTEGLSASIAELIINIISFILVLILSRMIMVLLCKVLNIFSRLPIIKQFNHLGGGVLGGVLGVVVLYAVFAILVVFAPLDSNSKITEEFEKSSFAGEMYENNILLEFIEKGREGGANGNT